MFNLIKLQSRNYSSAKTITKKFYLNKLKERSLIQVQSSDAITTNSSSSESPGGNSETVQDFLQGLITNDIKHLSSAPLGNGNVVVGGGGGGGVGTNTSVAGGQKCIYAMFLNKPGRLLYDTIIYRQSNNSYFIECDKEIDSDLRKHLQFFRVRKKINIDISKEHSIWVAFDPETQSAIIDDDQQKLENSIKSDCILCTDPRLKSLGNRLIIPVNDDNKIDTIIGNALPNYQFIIVNDNVEYKEYRYKLGIAEGIRELPIAKCFPLESNGDYLHGISFHKGCYLGQEFTARTHHTGVVRKRLMPIELSQSIDIIDNVELPVKTNDGKLIGKIRGISNRWAIGLLNIDLALKNSESFMITDNVIGKTSKPNWWPSEAPTHISKELIDK